MTEQTTEALAALEAQRERYRDDWWNTYRIHDWKEHRAINAGWCELERQIAALKTEVPSDAR